MIKAPGSRRHPIRRTSEQLYEMAWLNRTQVEFTADRAHLVLDGVHYYADLPPARKETA